MVNTNKILTVSYGTFSCTLEGFDDSFGTMKAIAEYFRDLAADDRYFGAEPPSPDAEMLARIAEREISRRVAAHRDENTFVLRAEPQPEADPALADPALPAPAEPDTAARAPQSDSAPQADNVPHADSAPQAESLPHASPEASPDPASEPPSAPLAEIPPAPRPTPVAIRKHAAQSRETPSAPEPVAGLSALVAESRAAQEPPAPADTLAPTDSTTDSPADSVASKLQRIRDVVAKHEAENTYSEDQHAEEPAAAQDSEPAEAFLARAQSDIAAALEADDTTETAATETRDTEALNAPAPVAGPEHSETTSETLFDKDTDAEEDISALLDRLSAEEPAAPAPETAAPPARARVIKVKKSDYEAALAAGRLSEEPPATDSPQDDSGAQAAASAAARASTLSQEEEDDLMRELAEVEAELARKAQDDSAAPQPSEAEDTSTTLAEQENEDDSEDDSEDDAHDNLFASDAEDDAETAQITTRLRAIRSARLTETASDDQMGRILQETNSKLDEDEGRGRRNAIAHLRAAVKATEAERDLGGELGADGRDTEVYRDDLHTAVLPRRPAQRQGPHARAEGRPVPPLKLVAEQRVDTPKTQEPVRPRRVRVPAPQAEAAQRADTTDFNDYIETVGAQNLGEVLEAAASYMAFIEGQDAFSRPQLMSKLQGTDHAATSREDRLRSFGQLLRAGKIRKLGGGQFEASEQIAYRPEKRASGG